MSFLRSRSRRRCRGGTRTAPAAGLLALALLAAAPPARAQLIPAFGGDRAGTSGFQFLKVAVDARAAAMGETVVANAFDASALFWNPALAAQAPGTQVAFNHTAYFADVRMEYAAALYHLHRLGLTLGGSLQALNSGDMAVTTEFEPFGTGERFRFVDVAAGLTVSQRLTDLFSYGVTAKYVRESAAEIVAQTAVFDLGIFYRIGATGLQTAVAIRNFGLDGTPRGELERPLIDEDGTTVEDDFEPLTPPTTFLLGVTYEALRGSDRNALLLSGQLINPNDNAESFNVGLEYTWNDLLILRSGYRFGVEEYVLPSVGFGLRVPGLPGALGLRFDYGFNRRERLGAIHRVGLNVNL
jgi:hypothetical protein